MDKKTLRKQFLIKRNQIGEFEQLIKSQQICERIINHIFYQLSSQIFIYSAFGSEILLNKVIEHAWNAGKTIALPKIYSNHCMQFVKITPNERYVKNRFGIDEPIDFSSTIYPNYKTFIIVPGLVFSHDNYRIGYGGGYYDRYFSSYPVGFRCGVAYFFQIQENLPISLHDLPLNLVISA